MANVNALTEKIRKTIRSRMGETLAETLIALLVAAVALIMLAGAMSASGSVITTGRNKLNAYYSQEEDMLSGLTAGASASGLTMTISDSSGDISERSFTVKYYENDEFSKTPVIAYK